MISFVVFAVFCLVLLIGAYTVVRARLRGLTCVEMLSRVRPAPESTVIPKTWAQVSAIRRTFRDLSYLTEIADRFTRVMASCTDDYAVANMRDVHETFMRKRVILLKSMLAGLGSVCCGIVGKRRNCTQMATIARYYTDELLLAHEMAEIIDPYCAALLEGQFLHGS